MVKSLLQPHQGQALLGAQRILGDFRHQCSVFERRQAGDQIVELKNKTHMLATVACQLGFAGGCDVMVKVQNAAGRGYVQSTQDI